MTLKEIHHQLFPSADIGGLASATFQFDKHYRFQGMAEVDLFCTLINRNEVGVHWICLSRVYYSLAPEASRY